MPTARRTILLLPSLLARPLALRHARRIASRYFDGTIRRVGNYLMLEVPESVTADTAPRAAGCTYYEAGLRELLRLLESIKRNKVALKGPITTPVGKGFTSVNVGLRKALDLYANLRPVWNLPGVPARRAFRSGACALSPSFDVAGTGADCARHIRSGRASSTTITKLGSNAVTLSNGSGSRGTNGSATSDRSSSSV